MQPLYLKLYNKTTNTVMRINGYELVGKTHLRFVDDHYSRTVPKDTAKVLRCTGIEDHTGTYLYEGEVVTLTYPDRTFKGVVAWARGAFVCEGLTEVITEWPNPQQIAIIDNIFTNPLALQEPNK